MDSTIAGSTNARNISPVMNGWLSVFKAVVFIYYSLM